MWLSFVPEVATNEIFGGGDGGGGSGGDGGGGGGSAGDGYGGRDGRDVRYGDGGDEILFAYLPIHLKSF